MGGRLGCGVSEVGLCRLGWGPNWGLLAGTAAAGSGRGKLLVVEAGAGMARLREKALQGWHTAIYCRIA